MIVKVCKRVTNVKGMVAYLMGPGKNRVHSNQHTVAGTVNYPGPDSTELRKQLTADLEMHSKLHPTVEIKGGPVYHVVLSLGPGEGPLADGKWTQISTEFMDQMGMTGTGGKSTMWTAVRHGLSADGNDHVHIVANLIRQDGTKVSLHNDMVRASKVARGLEAKHGLTVVAGRGLGGNQKAYTGGEIGRAQREGKEIERVELERKIRAFAEASSGEAEFVRRVRASGIEVRPYRGKGGAVTGYSVSMPGGHFGFAGGSLARDLSLPSLRARWAENKPRQQSAAHEWIKGRAGQPVSRYGPETRANMPAQEKVTAELTAIRNKIMAARTTPQLREVSRQLSGALAAGAQVDGRLVKPSREIAAWAPRAGSPHRFQMASVTMALLVAAQGHSKTADLVMTKMIVDALMELYRLHRMRAQSVHIQRTTRPRGVSVTEPDGMEEVLEGTVQTGTVALAATVQHVAQIGQEKLLEEARTKEAAAFGNRSSEARLTALVEAENAAMGTAVQQSGPPMTKSQQDTLQTIATRAGLDFTDLRLGDIICTPDLTVDQAGKLIDALGDPRYGSTGDQRHTLVDIRNSRGGGTATVTAPTVGVGTAQKYARSPQQQQGPGVGMKNQNVNRKI